jgi:hypothetical protein
MMDVFEYVLRELDETYLKWQRDQQQRRIEQTRPKK